MSDYIQDPNNSKKQIPGPKPDNYYGSTVIPSVGTFTKSPNSVMFNATNGTIGFFFGSSASFASASTSEGGATLTASRHYVSFGTPAEGTTLNIHPSAWSGSSTDSVTFIYKGGLDGSGRI